MDLYSKGLGRFVGVADPMDMLKSESDEFGARLVHPAIGYFSK